VLLDQSGGTNTSFTIPVGVPFVTVKITGGAGGPTCFILHGVEMNLHSGGGGGISTKHFAVTGGTVINYAVGSQGANGFSPPPPGPATAGSATTVTSPSMTGNGGNPGTSAANGTGGTASGGDTNTTGATGASNCNGGGWIVGRITITAHTS